MDVDSIIHEQPRQTMDFIDGLAHRIKDDQIVMKLRVQGNGGKSQVKNEILIDINTEFEDIHRWQDGLDYQFFVLKTSPEAELEKI